MNMGPCPYDGCDGSFFESIPDRTPAWAKLTCETCGRPVWYKFSRLDPEALTVEEFDAIYVVDEEAKRIAKRVPDPAVDEFTRIVASEIARAFAKRFEHEVMFGEGHTCSDCESFMDAKSLANRVDALAHKGDS